MAVTLEQTYTPEQLLGNPAMDGDELINGHLRERRLSKQSSRVYEIHEMGFSPPIFAQAHRSANLA